MAASGAGVLQLRAVEYARNHGIRLHCRSSFDDGPGTLVLGEDETMERPLVTAVTHAEEARVTLSGVSDAPGIAGRIFTALAAANVNVDMIIQNEPVSGDERADLSFTVANDDMLAAVEALEGLGVAESVSTDDRVGKVSVVGAGMRSHPGVAAKVFTVLGDEGVNIEMIATSPIKISCVIGADQVPRSGARAPQRVRPRRRRDPARGPNRRPPADRRDLIMPAATATGSALSGRPARWGPRSSRSSPSASFPAGEVVAFTSERSAGKQVAFNGVRARCVALAEDALDGLDIAISSAGGAVSAGVGAEARGGGSGGGRQHQLLADARGRSARRLRGEPRGDRLAPRDHRQPQLLDDADGRRAGSDPPRGRDRAHRRLDLPVGLRHRPAGRRRAPRADPRACSAGEQPVADVYPHQIAFNVLPQVETFKDGDDYTTEERKMMAETRKILGAERRAADLRHLRARAGRRRPLRVRERPDAR